jgi:predicted metal-dependent enzyme (double-stranded beta helix superfamily)
MFDLERFVADCEAAVAGGAQQAIGEIVRRAISDPSGIVKALGEPRRAGAHILHRSPRVTVLHILWPPHHTQAPHNHLIWAEVGVYAGREDNILWRRCQADAKWQIEAAGAASVSAGGQVSLAQDAIHSVNNPLDRVTAALHVYGGDFGAMQRNMWDAETLTEGPIDLARDLRAIEAYNATVEG